MTPRTNKECTACFRNATPYNFILIWKSALFQKKPGVFFNTTGINSSLISLLLWSVTFILPSLLLANYKKCTLLFVIAVPYYFILIGIVKETNFLLLFNS